MIGGRQRWPLLDLHQAWRRGPDAVGGKAASLARLHDQGIVVPETLVVPVQVFEAFLRHNGLWERAAEPDDGLMAAIEAGELEAGFAGRLRAATGRLGKRLAVRSSAVGEDGAEHSFAGQYRSVLGVALGDAVEDALKACWASAFGDTVRAYRGRGAGRPRMAVVIQEMVQPRSAGVMFTINPVNGSWREMTVEAAWGLGEAVVSGRVVPDFYRVRRPRRTPRPVQRVLARVRLDVLEERVGRQEQAWEVAGEGAHPVEVPTGRQRVAKLDRRELLRLCRLGLRVEARLGGPQDVEWAMTDRGRFVILQSRPVTATGSDGRSGPVAWSRRFVGERWTGPASPLGWSLMRDQLHWFIAYPDVSRRYLGGEEPTRLHRFAPYLNVTVFRHLAFKAPGAPPPRFMVELLPPEEESRWLRRRAHPPDFGVYAAIFRTTFAERRWERFRWDPVRNHQAWDAFESRLEQELPALQRPIRHRADAVARIEAGDVLVREYIKVHICSLLFANIWFQIAEAALNSGGLGQQVDVILRPDAETWTSRTNHALWRLGRGELELDEFLSRFGHRSTSSWELSAKRWVEIPEEVLRLAVAAAEQPDPSLHAERARADSDRALAMVRHPLVKGVVALARRYLTLREDQRFHFDRLLWEWKRAWAWIGDALELDVWSLEHTELRAVLDGTMSIEVARPLAARRRVELDAELARRELGDEPPVFLVGDQAIAPQAHGRQLRGLGISSGVCTGTVRVLRSPAEGHRLQPGDVLVARATDPGWTPLFLTAGAVVMELGGMLSHGAVVAREYGLPAVVNVPDACAVLEDGQTVTVDGNRGVVWSR